MFWVGFNKHYLILSQIEGLFATNHMVFNYS